MLDTFIRNGGTKNQRRLRAIASLTLFPFALVASVIVGTVLHLYDFVRQFAEDFKELIVTDIPHAVKEMVGAIKTGELR